MSFVIEMECILSTHTRNGIQHQKVVNLSERQVSFWEAHLMKNQNDKNGNSSPNNALKLVIPKFPVWKTTDAVDKNEDKKGLAWKIATAETQSDISWMLPKVKSDQCSDSKLHQELRDRFSGSNGNKHIMALLDLLQTNQCEDRSSTFSSQFVNSELKNLLAFSKKRNMRLKTDAQFNISNHIKSSAASFDAKSEFAKLSGALSAQTKAYNTRQMAKAKHRYLFKRNKRQSEKFIRYEERRQLANERTRVKGKFLKKNRIDVAKVAREMQRKSME